MDAEVALSDFCRSLMAMVEPGALVLVVAPSLRQSQEAFRHVSRMYLAAYGVVLDDDTLTSLRLELRNGSRIQVIPGDSDQTSESFGVFTFLGAAKWQHSR